MKKITSLLLLLMMVIALTGITGFPVCASSAGTTSESTSSQTISSASTGTTEAAKKVNKINSLLQSCKKVGKQIAAAKFKYGKSSKTNFEDSKSRKRSFCADYVTWALQENGDLSYSQRIYGTRRGTLSGSGRRSILKKYKLIRVRRRTSRVKFQPGDIICNYKISGKFGWHMMIFAKYDKNGHPLWYSGGSDATSGRKGYYSTYKLTTPRRLRNYEKAQTAFILRRKSTY